MTSGIRGSKRIVKEPVRLINEMAHTKTSAGSEEDPVVLEDGTNENTQDQNDPNFGSEQDSDDQDLGNKPPSSRKKRKARRPRHEQWPPERLREEYAKLLEKNSALIAKSRETKEDYTGKNKILTEEKKSCAQKLKLEEKNSATLEKKLDETHQKIESLRASAKKKANEHKKNVKDYERREQFLQDKIHNDQYQSVTDDVVENKLKLMEMRCSEWVKERHNSDNTTGFNSVWYMIRSDCVNANIEGLGPLLKSHLEKKGSFGVRTICMALLMGHIFRTYFRNPFELFKTHIGDVSTTDGLMAARRRFVVGEHL